MAGKNISIAMAYHNRLSQLGFTLSRLRHFNFEGEIVVCDDFSVESQNASLLSAQFQDLDIKVISPNFKAINPAHAFNVALQNCSKDIIILQNPECCWVGDVATFCESQLQQGQYVAFGCLWVDKLESQELGNIDDLRSVKGKMWVNHSKIDPRGLHFCAALHKDDLNSKLGGGFDERFNEGLWYDDNELLFRVKQELEFRIADEPYVLHQFHEKTWEQALPKPRSELIAQNLSLFEDTKKTYGTLDYVGILPKRLKN